MHTIALLLICLACLSMGRRLQIVPQSPSRKRHKTLETGGWEVLANLLLACNPSAGWQSVGFPSRNVAAVRSAGRSTSYQMTLPENEVSPQVLPDNELSPKVQWRSLLLKGTPVEPDMLPSSDEEWKRVLEPSTYAVLREEATEPMWSSELNDVKEDGVFLCAGCGEPLFTTEAKFDSGSGWPSFWAPATEASVITRTDFKLIIPRTETICARCKGHLGHVFPDGPAPTGKRYCMNGLALMFESGTERAEQAVTSFAANSANVRPPLVQTLLEASFFGLTCLLLLAAAFVEHEAKGGQEWAWNAMRSYKDALGVRPPAEVSLLVLGAFQGYNLIQKLPLVSKALQPLDD